jgi:molecular chaperone DnaK
MSEILAIDLGTTFTTAAHFINGQPEIIERMPSVVQFGFMGQVLVGEKALERKIGNRENTVDGIKRFLGRSFKEIEKELGKYTFGIQPDDKNQLLIDTFYNMERPEDIAALIIQEIKERAENKTGLKFTKVVLTTPASSTSTQRLAMKYAAGKTGLEVLKIINEPTAATLAYEFYTGLKSGKLAVYNFGGGMFDFSIVDINPPCVKILSTYGDTLLGGWDLVDAMVQLIIKKFQRQTGISLNLEQSLLLKAEFYMVAQEAMHKLSSVYMTQINIQNVARSENGEIVDINLFISRSEFEVKIYPIISRTIDLVRNTIQEANIRVDKLSDFLFFGGCSQIPYIRTIIEEFLISYTGKRGKIREIMARSLSIEQSINPQNIVALGAAVQIGILTKEISNMQILDIVTKSLGIKTHNDIFSQIIPNGTVLPALRGSIYTTVYNYQQDLEIDVLQGGKPKASSNTSLGRFILKDIESAPAGIPKVKVNFIIDESGIFNVEAEDLKTGVRREMVVEQLLWKL